jgi:hypothetical protein
MRPEDKLIPANPIYLDNAGKALYLSIAIPNRPSIISRSGSVRGGGD